MCVDLLCTNCAELKKGIECVEFANNFENSGEFIFEISRYSVGIKLIRQLTEKN